MNLITFVKVGNIQFNDSIENISKKLSDYEQVIGQQVFLGQTSKTLHVLDLNLSKQKKTYN